ncbi:MAG: tetratricopeptide repeat protein [Sandaracinaceae bacterium]|nr:tetratricopeptide repeat protein [Sandaracinaceae bacterium]
MAKWVGLLLFVALAGGSLVTRAQDRETARRHFEEADRQFEEGHFALALDGYQRSYEIMRADPRGPLILYNIGQCQIRLGRNRDALESFERYLAEAPPDAPFRENTLDHVRELRTRLAGDAPPSSEPSPSSSGPREDGLGALELTGLAFIGAGALAAAVAIPLGVATLDGEAQLVEACGATGACTPAQQGLLDDTRTLAVMTDVFWIAGLSIAAVGATLLAVGMGTRSSGVQGGAFCTEGGCVGSVRTRF